MLNSWKEWIERAQDLGFTEVATPARSASAEGSQSPTQPPQQTEHVAIAKDVESEQRVRILSEGDPTSPLLILVAKDPSDPQPPSQHCLNEPADRLLTAMIEKGLGVARNSIHILHMFLPQPPFSELSAASRDVLNARDLRRHIDELQPKVILIFGTAALELIRPDLGDVDQIRGQWFDCGETPALPTYHPNALLKDPSKKRATWVSLQALMARLGWVR